MVDNHTLFVAFEGRATEHTPLFKVGKWEVKGHPMLKRATDLSRLRVCRPQITQSVLPMLCCAVPAVLCRACYVVLCCAVLCCAVQGVDLFYFNDTATKIKEVQGESQLC